MYLKVLQPKMFSKKCSNIGELWWVIISNVNHPFIISVPGRLERIMTSLAENGLLTRCDLVRRSATLEELMSCHSQQHVHLYGISPLVRGTAGLSASVNRLPCGGWGCDTDTIWNDLHTPAAAKVAAGSVTELVNKGKKLKIIEANCTLTCLIWWVSKQSQCQCGD